jgi:hypothetical protein
MNFRFLFWVVDGHPTILQKGSAHNINVFEVIDSKKRVPELGRRLFLRRLDHSGGLSSQHRESSTFFGTKTHTVTPHYSIDRTVLLKIARLRHDCLHEHPSILADCNTSQNRSARRRWSQVLHTINRYSFNIFGLNVRQQYVELIDDHIFFSIHHGLPCPCRLLA